MLAEQRLQLLQQLLFGSIGSLPGAPPGMESGTDSTDPVVRRAQRQYPGVAGPLAHSHARAVVMDLGRCVVP